MPLYTRNEFAALCHTTTAVVSTNINRGKILLHDKKIDSDNPINRKFFSKYQKKFESEKKSKEIQSVKAETLNELYNDVVEKVSEKKIVSEQSRENEKKRREAIKEGEEISDWEKRKKIADALLQEKRVEKEHLQLEKMAGKLLPTDLVFNITRIHNQSIFATFQNDLENIASIWCDILGSGDRKKLGKMTEAMAIRLSDCVKRAEEVAQAGIENAVDDYSETRNRGERK